MNDSSNQHLTIHPPVWGLILAVVIAGCFFVYGKTMENRDRTPATISVTGEGKAAATPDIAQLSFGVQVPRQRTSKEAMAILTRQMTAVLDAVKNAGIEDKDITTEQLSLNPVYDWRTGTQTLMGYEAVQSLRVKVRDLDKTSDVLGAATAAGANQAGGVQFTVDDPEAARAEAREEAITQAKQKAMVLARQLGMSLGPVKAFSEGSYGFQPPVMMRAEMDAANGAATPSAPPLPAGEQEQNVTVTITYELR